MVKNGEMNMPRYNVNHNGKWACFSSIIDSFITQFMDKSIYETWRKQQYGISDYKPAEQCNIMTMKEAVFLIRLNRTYDEALECLLESGLPIEECKKILYDVETEYYCPVLKENGKYKCLNCGSEVEKGQVACNEEICELEFVWRL